MNVFFNAKVKVNGVEHAEKVLNYFYERGFKWVTNTPPKDLSVIGSLYVYENGKIFYTSVIETEWYFAAHENEELFINFSE